MMVLFSGNWHIGRGLSQSGACLLAEGFSQEWLLLPELSWFPALCPGGDTDMHLARLRVEGNLQLPFLSFFFCFSITFSITTKIKIRPLDLSGVLWGLRYETSGSKTWCIVHAPKWFFLLFLFLGCLFVCLFFEITFPYGVDRSKLSCGGYWEHSRLSHARKQEELGWSEDWACRQTPVIREGNSASIESCSYEVTEEGAALSDLLRSEL